jgi:hypothetical protein
MVPGIGTSDLLMKSKIRNRQDRRPPRTRQWLGSLRRPLRSFETLERRFLLSDATPTPKPTVEIIRGLNPQLETQVPTLLNLNPPPTVVVGPNPIGVDALSLGGDSFSLDPGAGMPQIRVGLLLSPDENGASGLLEVANLSGDLYYDVSLKNVDSVHASLPIPSNSVTPATLDIDLLISPSSSTAKKTGSFEIFVYWNQQNPPNEPTHQIQPQSLPSPTSTPSSGTGSSMAATSPSPLYPSFSATMNYPTTETGSSRGADNIPKAPDVSNPVPSASSGSGSGSGSASGSVESRPPVASSPISMASQVLSNSQGSTAHTANVGPLPLSATTPDGGIFAFPNAGSRETELDIEPTTTLEPMPIPVAGDAFLRYVIQTIRPRLGREWPTLSDPRILKAPVVGPSDLDRSSEPIDAGAVILAPLSAMVNPSRSEKDSRQTGSATSANRPGDLSRTIRVGPSIAATLIGTASLFFSLVAPDCDTRLTALREEESRRKRINSSKRRQESEPF